MYKTLDVVEIILGEQPQYGWKSNLKSHQME